jgi:succinate dehydrogenase hydrophobic anchor subunit
MVRKITSFVMLYSFVIMVISGVMLFIAPFGRFAMMIGWEFLGLDKMQWQGLHIIFMVIFTLAGILHIVYNFKAIKYYLKSKSKKLVIFTTANVVAIAITAIFFVGTIYKVEPLQSFVKLNKSFNKYWSNKYREKKIAQMRAMQLQMQQSTK